MDDDENVVEKALVMIAKPECLDCAHLIPDLRATDYDCYGDRNCPAITYQVGVGVDVPRYSNGLAEAMIKNDTTVMQQILARLDTVHPAVKDKVLKLARSKVSRHDG